MTARRRQHLPVLAAAVVAGAFGYVVLLVAARVLTPAENASFLVFWGALFGLFGVLGGVQPEMVRAAASSARSPGQRGYPLIAAGALIATLVAAAILATGSWWGPAVLHHGAGQQVLALAAGVVGFTIQSTICGILAGQGQWRTYALSFSAEPTLRLVLTVGVAVTTTSVAGLTWGTAAATFVWLVLLPLRSIRSACRVVSDIPLPRLLGNITHNCAGTAASALLVVGFPVLLRVTSDADEYSGAAALILAVSMSRAPLLVPLGAYQNVLVTAVLQNGVRALRRPMLAILALTPAGAALAAWVGPWVLRLLNPQYRISSAVFVALFVGAAAVALLTISGAACIALGHNLLYAVGWIASTIAAACILRLPWQLDTRTSAALVIAPLIGLLVHGLTLQRAARQERSRLPAG